MSIPLSFRHTPLAGVIGHPIAHSKSPKIHNYWLRLYGVAGYYVPVHVCPGTLRQTLDLMADMGFVGANVTIPYKQEALTLATEVSPRARLIGSANTLVFQENGALYADNTDGVGFEQNLRQQNPDWNPAAGAAVVFGAGGASRAVIWALINAGAPEVRVVNRTLERAEEMRRAFGPKVTPMAWPRNDTAQRPQTRAILAGAVSVINSTSLGMVGHPPFDLPLEGLEPGACVNDLVYTPLHTDFLAQAQARGGVIVDGLGMLLHQAVPGFAYWFGHEPQVSDDLRERILSA